MKRIEKSSQDNVKSMHIGTERVLGISIAVTVESDKKGEARHTEETRRLAFKALLRFAVAATRTLLELDGKLSRELLRPQRFKFLHGAI